MKLYILRHGEAATSAATDTERPLTERGSFETTQIIKRRRDSLSSLDAIYASPKLRAAQTAEIVRKLLPAAPRVATTELIKPNAAIGALTALLEPFAAQGEVLLVSHQPLVGNLIDYLTDKPATGRLMSTSCLACLDVIAFTRGCATLEWLEIP